MREKEEAMREERERGSDKREEEVMREIRK